MEKPGLNNSIRIHSASDTRRSTQGNPSPEHLTSYERRSQDLATGGIQTSSRLGAQQDVFGHATGVWRCDPACLGEYLREDLATEADHVSQIRAVSHVPSSQRISR
jgi:hypothetical protein